MNELEMVAKELTSIQVFLVSVIFLLGMTAFAAKLGDNSLGWSAVALVAVFSPIFILIAYFI